MSQVYDSNGNSLDSQTHSLVMGYVLWIFGFMGAHRFYYGKPVSGALYFCTLGLFFIGWFVDLFLMPGLASNANHKYLAGKINYNVAWILLTFVGFLGIHRFYMGKWITGIIYLLTAGLFTIGILYDFLNLNGQIDEVNNQ